MTSFRRISLVFLGLQILFASPWTGRSSVWANATSNSVILPPLHTDLEKLSFLLEIKKKIPQLFHDTSRFELNLFSLLDDEVTLLTKLKQSPNYLQEFEHKTYSKITITPPPEGLKILDQQIQPEVIESWKQELLLTIQEFQEEDKSHNPEIFLQDKTAAHLANLPEIQGSFRKLYGSLLAEIGKQKPNQALFKEKIGTDKDLDLPGRLSVALEIYDQFPVHPPSVSREKLQEAIQTLAEFNSLKDVLLLQLLIHRPGQVHLTENAVATWSQARESIKKLNSEDLFLLNHTKDLIAELIQKQMSFGPIRNDLKNSINLEINKTIEFYATQMTPVTHRITSELHLIQVPPSLGIFRGCAGGDCSSRFSFPYPNDPHEFVFFLEDGEGKLKGYVSATEVLAQEKSALYINSISGYRISAGDTELILTALNQVKSGLGMNTILLPEYAKIRSLNNFIEPQSILEKYARGKDGVPISYKSQRIRQTIEKFDQTQFNVGKYDHMSENQKGVILEIPSPPQSKTLSIRLDWIEAPQILTRSFDRISDSELLEFLLDLKHSNKRKTFEKVLSIPEIQIKINAHEFNQFIQFLGTPCHDETQQPTQFKTFQNLVQARLSRLSVESKYLETHQEILYPALVSCTDAFEADSIQFTTKQIVKDLKSNEDGDNQLITPNQLPESAQKSLLNNEIFINYTNKMVQQLTGETSALRAAAAKTLGKIGSRDPEIHRALAKLLTDPDAYVREEAVFAFGEMHPQSLEIHEALAKLLGDKNRIVRGGAAGVLGEIQITDPRLRLTVIQGFERLLNDKYSTVQRCAIFGLGQLKTIPPETQATLSKFLSSKLTSFRLDTVVALGKIQPQNPKIQAQMAQLLKDDFRDVRTEAAIALKGILPNDPQIHLVLVDMLKSYYDSERNAAKDLLILIRPTHDEVYLKLLELKNAKESSNAAQASLPILEVIETNSTTSKTLMTNLITAFHEFDLDNPEPSRPFQLAKKEEIYGAITRLRSQNQTLFGALQEDSKRATQNCLEPCDLSHSLQKSIESFQKFELLKRL